MSIAEQPDELHELIDQAIDGVLPEERLTELTAALQDDPKQLAELIDGSYLHAQLNEMASCQRSLDDCLAAVEKAAGSKSEQEGAEDTGGQGTELFAPQKSPAHSSPLTAQPSGRRRFRASRHKLSISVAVSVAVVMSGLLAMHLMEVGPFIAKGGAAKDDERNKPAADKVENVATLTGWYRPEWLANTRPSGYRPRLEIGRSIVLESGFVEVTYDRGTRVVLEGPVQFEILGDNSAKLTLGKASALVREESAQGFSIDTPTHRIADLGTEFAVSVTRSGDTFVEVFDGKVSTAFIGGSEDSMQQREVAKDEAVLFEVKSGAVREYGKETRPVAFNRTIPAPRTLTLDVLDLIAGGNGFGRKANCGIELTTGEFTTEYTPGDRPRKNDYQKVVWNEFVDGVFIPNGEHGAMQVTSAGHRVAEFPKTLNKGYGPIWIRRPFSEEEDLSTDNASHWIFAIGRVVEFNPNQRGVLGLHSNAGVTLDLGAARGAIGNGELERFRSVVGVAGTAGVVDLWVVIDGKVRWSRRDLKAGHRPLTVDVELNEDDRFLTLITSDAGNLGTDWAVFGDPVFEIRPVIQAGGTKLTRADDKERINSARESSAELK